MINTILFRPQNDDPSLQLLCIVQYVGGLTLSLLDRFPSHIKKLFSKIKFDHHQQRLQGLLQQIFNRYRMNLNEYSSSIKDHLLDLLKQMFQFQSDKRISLESIIEHPFYSINNKIQVNSSTVLLSTIKTSSIQINDLVHLCTKFNLTKSRWILTLKERCLFELILHIQNFNQFNSYKYGLSQSLQLEIQKLIYFLTGN
jgi:serine/threonine protein kinase